jgi:RNA methyltransferase, TrmH family
MRSEIFSRSNRQLREFLDRKERIYLLEGEKLVRDVLSRPIPVQKLIVLADAENRFSPAPARVDEIWVVNRPVMEKISDLKDIPECAVAFSELERPIDFSRERTVIGLDNIQDPANLGTIFRCASAFGIDAIALTGAGVNPRNTKFIRTAQTSLLDLRFQSFPEPAALVDLARENHRHLYLTAAGRARAAIRPDQVEDPCLIFFGNEGHGLDGDWLNSFPVIRLPQNPRIDSLNVGISACIVMYELQKRPKA